MKRLVTPARHPGFIASCRGFQVLDIAPLTPLPEKRERVAQLGLDALDVLPFTRELAALPPDHFVDEYLIRRQRLRVLVVGGNFALGKGRAGDVRWLTAYGHDHGFEVVAMPLLELDGAPVTSTRIRGLLAEGRVAESARLLGRRYALAGRVVGGHAIGRTLGFPTANLQLHDEKFVPADGIYAVEVTLSGRAAKVAGAMSIGMRPTFGGTERTLEVFLLDWSGDLAGASLEVEFVAWIRGEVKFASAAELIEAMKQDVERVREVLAAPRAT